MSRLVQRREISPVELTEACLSRIEAHDGRINSFITVLAEEALREAKVAEREILQGRSRGPLHGVPIAIKDNIDTAGTRTTAASAVFAHRVPTADAEVVRRLKQAGSILIGKLNLTEFALGLGPTSYTGAVNNPWNLEYEAGGSSSGPAAAVAADFCYGSLGSDVGGSIRFPAHCCGVVGFKPTFGLVSSRGLIPTSEILDHVGPMGRSALDIALMMNAIAGYDPQWFHSISIGDLDYAAALRNGLDKQGLGIPKAHFMDRLDPEIADLFISALTVFTEQRIGHVVSDNVVVDKPDYYPDELFAEGLAYHQPLFESHADLYQPETRKTLEPAFGSERPSAVGYINAIRRVGQARKDAAQLFRDGIDVLVLPTWKEPPIKTTERQRRLANPGTARLGSNTSIFNVLGLPAISVPCGITSKGLPVGLQIVGPHRADAKVIALAHAYERATNWHAKLRRLQS